MVATEYSVVILGRNWLTADTFELVCSRPPQFSWVAGQHVSLTCQGQGREYSLLCAPGEANLRFLIKRIEHGHLSNLLAEVEVGASLGMSKAKGYLVYRPTEHPVYFVATGVGIAPFVAMAAAEPYGYVVPLIQIGG